MKATEIVNRHRGVPGWTRDASIDDVESALAAAYKEGLDDMMKTFRTVLKGDGK